MPLAGDAVVGAGAAQRHALIDRHIVADLGGFADDGKSVVDEEVAADLHPGVNVDGGQKPREVVHHTGQEIQRSEEHTSELQSLMRISYAVFCLKKKTKRS